MMRMRGFPLAMLNRELKELDSSCSSDDDSSPTNAIHVYNNPRDQASPNSATTSSASNSGNVVQCSTETCEMKVSNTTNEIEVIFKNRNYRFDTQSSQSVSSTIPASGEPGESGDNETLFQPSGDANSINYHSDGFTIWYSNQVKSCYFHGIQDPVSSFDVGTCNVSLKRQSDNSVLIRGGPETWILVKANGDSSSAQDFVVTFKDTIVTIKKESA